MISQQQTLPFPERSASFQRSPIDSPKYLPIPYLEGIHKCPVEVLTEIFINYLEDNAWQLERLLFVCRQWYLLIIHTPLFWTRITLSISKRSASVASPRLCFVETFIQRSKGMLLDIEVKCSNITHHPTKWRNYCPAFTQLYDNMYRCQTLHVTLPADIDLSGIVCGLFKGPAPNMVKLSVRNSRYRSLQQVAFSELPNLRILEMDVYPFKEMVHLHRSLPLAQLHSLDLSLHGSRTWARAHGLNTWNSDVSLFRCLRSLQIRYMRNNAIGTHLRDSIQDPISLPLLESLGLWGLERLDLRLELPALRSLSFDGVNFPNTNPVEVIWRPGWEYLAVHSGILKAIILHYRSAKLFVLPDWTEEALVSTLQVMEAEGSVPDSTVSFMKERMDGSRKPMEIQHPSLGFSIPAHV
jgi:hypothetical protein